MDACVLRRREKARSEKGVWRTEYEGKSATERFGHGVSEEAADGMDEMEEDGGEEEVRASFLWYLLPLLSVAFFYAAPGFLLWHLARQTVLQLLFGLFFLAVLNGLTAIYHGWRRCGVFLERSAMLMKCGLIPFHLALFIAAMVSGDFAMGAANLWGRTVIISTWDVLLALFLLAFLFGMGYALAAIETAVGEDRLHLLWALFHGIAQGIPLVDLLSLIWFVAVQEGRVRFLSLFALLLLLTALVAAGLLALRFLG